MTSAPVKDVNSLMNFVGGKNLTKTGGMDQTGGFGDVMSKARYNSPSDNSRSVAEKQAGKQPEKVSQTASDARRETLKTSRPEAKEAAQPEDTAENQQALLEAGRKVADEAAKELGVTAEDVERAMEELGFSFYSLLEPSNLTQLVLTLSGEQDAAALLTDENLFASLQDMLGMLSEVKTGLMQEMNLEPEDMQALLEAVKAGEGMQTEENPAANMEAGGMEAGGMEASEEEAAPQITIEVKAAGEEIRLTADEKGNVTGAAQAAVSETEESAAKAHADSKGGSGDGKKGQPEGMMHTENQLIDALLSDRAQAAEGTFEQPGVFFSQQTQDIMNQIMDYMKIQLKPGMDQLEMQLHPASLGTVQVQLSNRGGEVTAHFHVQSETVKAALESQIAVLQESFKEQGIKVSAVQVSVESRGFESNLWQGQGREENASSQNGRRTPRRINLNDADVMFGEDAGEEEQLAVKMMEANGNTVDYTA